MTDGRSLVLLGGLAGGTPSMNEANAKTTQEIETVTNKGPVDSRLSG